MNPDSCGPMLPRRTLLAGCGVAIMASTAGCGAIGGNERADPDEPIAYVPATASLVVDVDMAVAANEESRRLVEAYAEADTQTLFEQFESQTGLDIDRTREVVVFAADPGPGKAPLVVDAEYEASAAVDAIESSTGTDYEEVDHETGTVYRPAADTDDAVAMGFVARNQFVYGDESSVRTALDVFDGTTDQLGGPLMAALQAAGMEALGPGTPDTTEQDDSDDDRTDYVVAGTDQPRAYLPDENSENVPQGVSFDIYETVETATAAYFVADGQIGVDIVLRVPSEDGAGDIEDFTASLLTFAESRLENRTVAQEFGKAEVGRDGTVVTITYRTDVDGAAALASWL